ncbi:MAG: 30S ribosomal protein S17 [Elusimicrobiota bacterium]
MAKPKQKIFRGTVVSDKMNKSRVVLISRRFRHPLYEKVITRSTKLMVHDEKNESKKGDLVDICLIRPLSKNKCWKLVKIVESETI